jgi:non-homologous end joining protein Ku
MAAARANWKGYLRLSLISCPIALFPATIDVALELGPL